MNIHFNKIFVFLYSALFLVTPLLMYHRTSEIFEFNKLLCIYFITILVTATWITRMIINKRIIFTKTIFTIPLILFLLSQILSTIFSIDHHTSFFGYYGRFNGGLLSIISYILLYFAFVSNISQGSKTKHVLSSLLKVSMLSSVIVMLWGLPSRFGYDLTCFVFSGKLNVDCWTDQFKPTIRIFSTLGQPNWLGAYLSIHFFIGLYYYFKKSTRLPYYAYLVYMFANFSFILLTRSRSSLIALGIGMLFFGAYIFIKKSEYISNRIFKKRFTILAALFVISLLLFKSGIDQIDRFITFPAQTAKEQSKAEEIIPSADDESPVDAHITDSFSIRKLVWEGGVAVGKEYPLFGTGVETFAYSYNFTRPIEHNNTSEWDYVYNKAHNEFINYFATSGTFGFITYLILIALVLMHAKNILFDKNPKEDDRFLTLTLLLAYITILVTNFLGFSTTTINIFFYILPGFLIFMLYPSSTEKEISEKKSINLSQNQKVYLIFPALLILLGGMYIVQYFYADTNYALGENYRILQDFDNAQLYYLKAYKLRNEHVYADKLSQLYAQKVFLAALAGVEGTVPTCIDPFGNSESCVVLFKKYNDISIKASPYNVFYWRTKSRNNFLMYQAFSDEKFFDESIEAMRQARQISPSDPRLPYNQALYNLARHENLSNPSQTDIDKLSSIALGEIDFAIKLKPDYGPAYYAKGIILKEIGRNNDAREVFEYMLKTFDAHDEKVIKELEGL